MSTSYKNTFKYTRPKPKLKYLSEVGHVTSIRTQTNSLELEGTISIVTEAGKPINVVFPRTYNKLYMPLIGELVPLYKDNIEGRYYYGDPLNIHNYPTHSSPNSAVTSTPDYIEPTTINPYSVFTGDTLFQGRFGQSLRFSQTIPDKTPWQGEQGKSVIVLSSGQVQTPNGAFAITEDINHDAASLFLLEGTQINLQDSSKRDSYETPIQSGNVYEGNQAILNSDRLYLNARQDSVLLSAQSGSIGLSADTINVDSISSIRLHSPTYNINSDTFIAINQDRTVDSQTTTYNYDQFTLSGTNINVNHTRIGLGENATEPLLQSTEFLADLATLNANLTQLATSLKGIEALLTALPGGQVPALVLSAAATSVATQASNIQTKVGSGAYLSTTVFTK